MTSTTTSHPSAGADADHDTTEATNARIGVDFLKHASSGRAREAWGCYGAEGFVHHNPFFAGDAETLITAMDANAREHPDKVLDVLRTIAQGNLVAVHSRSRMKPADRGGAVVHIFRIEDGRIRELWDIGQEVPESSPNQHGMF
jgi:predicted SnoaL-like aldol condensation-catalyzing enzyme